MTPNKNLAKLMTEEEIVEAFRTIVQNIEGAGGDEFNLVRAYLDAKEHQFSLIIKDKMKDVR